MSRGFEFSLTLLVCGLLLTATPATGQGDPPKCTGKTMGYMNSGAANCGQGVNCPPQVNGECVGETIWIDPNAPTQWKCTSEFAVASSNCIDWNTSEICGSGWGCSKSVFLPTICTSNGVKLRDIYFNQAGTGGNCTVVTQ